MDPVFLRADELGIRLEIVRGLPLGEPHPVYKHQEESYHISPVELEFLCGCRCRV